MVVYLARDVIVLFNGMATPITVMATPITVMVSFVWGMESSKHKFIYK